ncbi:MAG: hypothetical protein K6E29_01605 [Cyanobacteria bacterium RUI128]|nr:hypothetical protein [Cyanobacteria bacterium RUI128]
MRVSACDNISFSNKTCKSCVEHKAYQHKPTTVTDRQYEYDYGKCLKQMSYILGITILGISGLIMAVRGKKAP